MSFFPHELCNILLVCMISVVGKFKFLIEFKYFWNEGGLELRKYSFRKYQSGKKEHLSDLKPPRFSFF